MSDDHQTFWEHLNELRNALVKTLLVILLGSGCAFYFYQEIFTFLSYSIRQQQELPLELDYLEVHKERLFNSHTNAIKYQAKEKTEIDFLSDGVQHVAENVFLIPPNGFIEINSVAQRKTGLVLLSPLEGFSASLRVSFWIGLIGSSPIWIFFIMQFLLPALHLQERKILFPFLLLSLLFMCSGLLFAFYITIPMTNHYLHMFNQGIGLNLWTLDNYLSYTITLLLSNAFAFEMAVILFFLVHYGFLSGETMKHKRRHVIVLAFIIGAILTPPDVLSQLLLAIPLIVMYETAIVYANYMTRTWTKSFFPWSSRY